MFADLILPIPIGDTFTYGVPEGMESVIKVGARVEISFGAKKKYAALVLRLHENKPSAYKVKPILEIIDLEPILQAIHLQFWQWIADYYMCSLGEVMMNALPNYLRLGSETLICINPLMQIDSIALSDDEFMLMEALEIHKELRLEEIEKIITKVKVRATLASLIHKQVIVVFENIKNNYKPKIEKTVHLLPHLDNENSLKELFTQLEKAPKQLHILLSYLHLVAQENIVRQVDLLGSADASATQLKAMVDKNIFSIEMQTVSRAIFTPSKSYAAFTLNEAQNKALQYIVENLDKQKPILLHGVTGSGKTNVHIKTIEHFLQQGKQVLYLLPEIALTAQIINKLFSVFGDAIGIYHSKFSNSQRLETWMNVLNGKIKILIGARSSLFMPFNNLGLIIVDEEHDASYKQSDKAPFYTARDAALVYAKMWNANIVLSTATPSVESYNNAINKKYLYTSISKRYADLPLPTIEILDNKNPNQAPRVSNILGDYLLKNIQDTLQKKQQVILFQNRRGFAPYLYCSSCGWHAVCANCDVNLSYHKQTDKLHCHYCGTKWPLYKTCPSCQGAKLYFKNYGTERIEDEVKKLFPHANVSRLDTDTARTKNKYQHIIKEVEHNVTNILIGTQMVVKGLDFDNVQLVAVLHADALFTIPHFRVNERAFQLLAQVSGRSGRKTGDSKVIFQTFQVHNPILHLVKDNNYKLFFAQEIKQRQAFYYPPFVRLIKIVVRHKVLSKTIEAASILADQMKSISDVLVIGPATPSVGRVQNLFVEEILLKCSLNTAKLILIKTQVKNIISHFNAQVGNSTVRIAVDVDPS